MFKKYSRQQLLVLLGGCLVQMALLGILVNSVSVLMAAITGELGMEMTRVSAYHTLKSIASTLSAAALTTLFFRMNKGLFMAFCIGGVVVGHLMLAVGAGTWLWWASAILIGLSFSTCGICVPFMLGKWFPKNAGFATGFALAFSGVGGVIFNPVASRLIRAFGWRSAIVVMSVITAAVAIPGLILLFGKRPPESEIAEESAARTSEARSPRDARKLFFLCMIMLGCGTVVVQFNYYISTYATDLGYALETGAMMASLVMAGNVLGKLIYGAACDRIGVWKASQCTFLALILSMLLMLFGTGSRLALFAGALIFGSVYGINMIAISRGCIAAFGEEGSKKYMGLYTSIFGAMGSVLSFLVGPLYDRTGSFAPLLWINLGVLVLGVLAVFPIRKILKDR